jgi:hypothetical protein
MGEARDKYQSQCPDFFKLVDEPDERKGWFKVTKRVLDDHCLMYLLSGCAAGLPAAGLLGCWTAMGTAAGDFVDRVASVKWMS